MHGSGDCTPLSPIDFDVPAGSCDCHTHVHGDPETFPLWSGRTYTPEIALPRQLAALHERLGVQRVVVVTPSVYGTDNSATLHGMAAHGRDARGVAVIDAQSSQGELDRLQDAGVRGIRLNLATAGTRDPTEGHRLLESAIEQVHDRGWHVQLYTHPPMIAALNELIRQAPTPIVLDHFGGARAGSGVNQHGFGELLDLVRGGHAYVKLSGAYRASDLAPDYADIIPLARALIAANAERVLWGTDWPHPDAVTPPGRPATDVTPHLRIDDGRLLNQLAVWAPDAGLRRQILVDNPARLYGF